MQIEIFADIIVSLVLDRAAAAGSGAGHAPTPQIKARIIWRAFLLNPSLPDEGMDKQKLSQCQIQPAYFHWRFTGGYRQPERKAGSTNLTG